jgi:hypothetical protein
MTTSLSSRIAPCAAGLFLVVGFVALPRNASARQTPVAPSTCATLLTADEITKATGGKFQDMGARPRSEGETECPWMLRGDGPFRTVSVQFFDSRHIKASPNASTPEAFFETYVAAAEGVATGKREMLPGVGQKAAFVPTSPQTLVIVQRADGVARIVANGLDRAQITAVARAVAAP